MSLNELTITVEPRTGRSSPVARLVIDGRDLVAMVSDAERAITGKAGKFDYERAADVLIAAHDALGNDDAPAPDGTELTLLGCDCGVASCWPLRARTVVTETTVTWRDFVHPAGREISLAALGPFVFDRDDYANALGEGIAALFPPTK